MTARRRYGTPGSSADSTVGGTSVGSQDARVPVASLSSNAARIAYVTSPRAALSVANSHGTVPAKRTRVSSAVPLSQGTISTTGTRAWCAVPLGHGPNSAKATCVPSSVPLSRGINSATGGRVPNAAPLNHGKGACTSRAAPPSHASRTNEAAATARRPPTRTCSPSPLSSHVVAVGLRCGKANTKTPRSFARLDPMFPHRSSGRSVLFPIEEESARLATSYPFSLRPNGKGPSRVGLMLPPTRAPLLKTPTGFAGPASSSRTLTHAHQAASVPVEQEEPTLRDEPVVTTTLFP